MTNQDELHEAIQAIHAGGGYGDVAEDEGSEDGQAITHRYYFVSTKAPDNKAIDSLLDRAFGKSVQRIAATTAARSSRSMTTPSKKSGTRGETLSIRRVLEDDLDGKAGTQDIRSIFAFDATHTDAEVLQRFRLWSRHFFFKYFHVADAPFHAVHDARDVAIFRGSQPTFINAAFRGAAKTTRAKLFFAYAIANDHDHRHRFIKTLSQDYANAKQNVTDLYNLLSSPRLKAHYPEIFEKTTEKREEPLSSFTACRHPSFLPMRAGQN